MVRWMGFGMAGACIVLVGCALALQSRNDLDREWVPTLRIVERKQDFAMVRYEREGVPLYAEIYYPPNRPQRDLPAVVLLPGGFVGVNATQRASARRIADAGYLVALPHMRGQGKSGGFIDFGLSDAVDAQGLARALTQLGGRGDYAFVGISFGATIALNAARNNPQVRGVGYVMGPTDFAEQRQMLINYGRPDRAKQRDAWIGGSPEECPSCYEERNPLRHAREVEAPVLFIQAGEDVMIPVWQACNLMKVREEMGRPVYRVALSDEGELFQGTLKPRQQCVLPLTGWGDLKHDHLVLFPSLPHRTNEAVWQVVLNALNRWFQEDESKPN
ncbi:MAG: alpha/beta fold hydrolase [Fimbriimonadales bacterium]